MINVSVIIPTYNRCERLKQAIRSVLAQSGAIFELMIVDDGSTDDTRSMIEKEFPQVTYSYQKNQGPSAARNAGIKKAKGQWIAFLDSDDVWLPLKLSAQLDFCKKHPSLLIHQTEEIWMRNAKRVNPMIKHKKRAGWIFEDSLELCLISPSAVMIHRSLFDEVGLFNESLPACEDYDLWLRITSRFEVGLIEKPYVVRSGGHADQLSKKFPAMDQFRIESVCRVIQSGQLNQLQLIAAWKVLEAKMLIYCQGAIKRNKIEEVRSLQKKIQALQKPNSWHETVST